MSNFAVKTVFTALDKVSPAFKKMGAGATKFGRLTAQALDKASIKATNFKQIIGGILSAQIIGRGLMLLREGIGTVITEFIDFDAALTRAAAKFPEKISKGTKAFNELSAAARQVGATTEFSSREAGEGLEFLAMAGFNAAQAAALLPSTVDLATASNLDLARSTDIASDALGAFGLMTEDTGQLTKNMGRINDVFAATVTSANTDMEQLFETMKMAGPVMTTAGQSVETFAALTGVMANAGIKGSLSGTALRTAVLNLTAAGGKGARKLKALGISVKDSDGNMRDLVDILGDVDNATRKMGTATRAATLETIFGKRAIAGVSVLLDKGGEGLRKYRDGLEQSGGAAAEMADKIRKSLGNRIKVLKSTLIELGFKFVEAFEEKLPGAIDSALEAIRKFDVEPIIEAMKDMGGAIKFLFKWGKKLSPLLIGIAAGFAALKVAAIAVSIKVAIASFVALVPAIMGAGSAFAALGVIFAANPIGVIVAAVAALVTAGVLLYQNWDTVKEKLGQVFLFIKEKLDAAWDWFSRMLDNPFFTTAAVIVAPWLTLPALIVKHWEPVRDFFIEILNWWEELLGIKKTVLSMGPGADKDGLVGAVAPKRKGGFAGTKKLEDKGPDIDKVLGKGFADKLKGIKKTDGKTKPIEKKDKGLPKAQLDAMRAGFAAFSQKTKPVDSKKPAAPNETAVETRRVEERQSASAKLTIEGAPPGSKLKKAKNMPPNIDFELLGANP